MSPLPFFQHCAVQTLVPIYIYVYVYISISIYLYVFSVAKWKCRCLSPELVAEKLQFCFCECIAVVCGQTPVTFSCVRESTFLLKCRKRMPRNGCHCVGLGTEGIALLQMLQLLAENLGASVL